MDIDVSGWILEFLLRQNSLDNSTLNDLIRVLPIPQNNPRLKKRLILRKIESDVEKNKISYRTIELLEQIEELDLREGSVEVSEAMKAAYCTFAMYCTAKSVEEGAGDMKEKYASAASRILTGRIKKIEMSDVAKVVGLVKDDLLRWMNDIEARVLDVDACENVLAKFKGLDVLDALRRYLHDEKEKMGPSFLETACETILSDPELSKIMGLIEDSEVNNQNKDKDNTPTVDPTITNDTVRAHVQVQQPKHKPVGPKCVRKPGHGTQRGAKIVDPMETHTWDDIPTPVFKKVQEALRRSCSELHAVVTDPLPEALRFAESLKTNISQQNTTNDNVDNPSPSHDRKGKNLQTNENNGICRDQSQNNNMTKPNLMERNSTAHTLEWSDSIDSPNERSPIRPHLPSPRKRPVSPLNLYDMAKLVKHRRKKRWSTLEEDTLRTGVQKYGKGNWKLILNIYRDMFEDRTEVDLKDKWRNMTRW